MICYLMLCIIIINIIKDLAIIVHCKYVLIHKMLLSLQNHSGTQVQAKLESETFKDHIRRNCS